MHKAKFFTTVLITLFISIFTIGCASNNDNADKQNTEDKATSEVKETSLVDNGVPKSERDRPMRVLLINDDGYESIGIELLHEKLEEKDYDVWTVAPIENQSGTGTSIQWNSEKHELIEYGKQKFAFEGTPTDSFKAAVNLIMDEKPDLVISGINDGPNYGEVQMNSGTVSGAARAIRHGYPSIAASLNWFGEDDNQLEEYMKPAVDYVVNMVDMLDDEWKSGEMLMPLGTGLSINYPAEDANEIKGVKFVDNEELYSDFQNYKYDEEKEGIYNYNDTDLFNSLIEDEEIETDLTLANRGYVTVSVIDGNWNAEQEKIDYMKSLLEDLEPIN